MKYCILKDNYDYALENSVAEKIKLGWEPLGGVSCVNLGSSLYYCQAMIKYQFNEMDDFGMR